MPKYLLILCYTSDQAFHACLLYGSILGVTATAVMTTLGTAITVAALLLRPKVENIRTCACVDVGH